MKYLVISIEAALLAGEEIMKVYAKDFEVELKSDHSPLTQADKNAHEIIKSILEKTGLPILSEEGKQISFDERKHWDDFWLVDPLDGTKEFIKKNGEFTVNIALIKNCEPVLGVVYLPVKKMLYFGSEGDGSYKIEVGENKNAEALIDKATLMPDLQISSKYTIVASRSHSSPETEDFIEKRKIKYGEVDLISAGSSIKLCLVAEGKAAVYPRLAPTMEWDTAAGHAVAKYAGCKVYDYKTEEPLVYNKENLLNPWFVVERE
jgi:3'(2'), 5'-bisphosphate nucleotidase